MDPWGAANQNQQLCCRPHWIVPSLCRKVCRKTSFALLLFRSLISAATPFMSGCRYLDAQLAKDEASQRSEGWSDAATWTKNAHIRHSTGVKPQIVTHARALQPIA
jgi:hypothetical protein